MLLRGPARTPPPNERRSSLRPLKACWGQACCFGRANSRRGLVAPPTRGQKRQEDEKILRQASESGRPTAPGVPGRPSKGLPKKGTTSAHALEVLEIRFDHQALVGLSPSEVRDLRAPASHREKARPGQSRRAAGIDRGDGRRPPQSPWRQGGLRLLSSVQAIPFRRLLRFGLRPFAASSLGLASSPGIGSGPQGEYGAQERPTQLIRCRITPGRDATRSNVAGLDALGPI